MITENFGKRIKELRLEKGLSQEKFALMADLDRTYLCGLEKGKRNIALVNIAKLAKTLNISLQELFTGVEYDDEQ